MLIFIGGGGTRTHMGKFPPVFETGPLAISGTPPIKLGSPNLEEVWGGGEKTGSVNFISNLRQASLSKATSFLAKPGVGLEPTTSTLPEWCSNHLSYPGNFIKKLGGSGLEPETSGTSSRRSAS